MPYAKDMRTSNEGMLALITHEGIVPGPYFDAVEVLTVFIGHTAAAGAPDPATMPRGVPSDLDAALREAFRVFRKDLLKYEAEVADAIKVQISQEEFDAAVSFHYNTGAIGRASWVKSLNAGKRATAAKQFMNWKKPASIIDRRKAEQTLFRDGHYPKTRIVVWGVNTAGRVIWKPIRTLTRDEALVYLQPADRPQYPSPQPAPAKSGGVMQIIIGLLQAFFGRNK